VRLLLDEHYSVVLAERLRGAGYDVIAVVERGLAGTDDESLLAWAAANQAVVLTNNVQDFLPLHAAWMASGRGHHGLWLTDDRRMPRAKGTIGLYLEVLGAKLAAHPEADAFVDQVVWLP